MADSDRARWNARYSDRRAARPMRWEPTRWLPEIREQLQPPHAGARALDLACGPGRNAVWLAEQGWTVDAWDLSDVALAILRDELDRRAVLHRGLPVTPTQVDLDTATIPPDSYDLLANVLFLDRRLWPQMADALRPGGLLVFETFVNRPGGRTSEVSPAHLLEPGELRAAFEALGLTVLLYDEENAHGTARLLARRP
ncbi:MAG: methyltransferase domain-containing protein [Gemmataceae bacterium]|nr:methyltransferase domain-containing protein [Gemmataceae bacterium]